MNKETSVVQPLTYWIPKLTNGAGAGGGLLYPQVLIAGRGKLDDQHPLLDSRERMHPDVFVVGDNGFSRMESVLRSVLITVASGHDVSVVWERQE